MTAAHGKTGTEALALILLVATACPMPEPERPEGPSFRLEVVRSSEREDGFGDMALVVDSGGAAHLAFNDLDYQAVGLAHRRPAGFRVEYPIARPSWTAVGLEAAGEGFLIRYVVAPRTLVAAVWDGRTLEESERQYLDEEALREQLWSRAHVVDGLGRPQGYRMDGPDGLRSDTPLLDRCGRLAARQGWRIADRSPAVTMDPAGRPRVLFFERHNDERTRLVLRYATCEGDGRWAVTTVGRAAATYAALAVDALGHPHLAFVRPREGGGEELVYATDAAPPEPTEPRAPGCPAGGLEAEGGRCEPRDPLVDAALEACGRLEIGDEAGPTPEEAPDGFRCLILDRTPERARLALDLSLGRCQAGEALGCYLAAALRDYATMWMLFDPLLCDPPPGGACNDHVVRVVGAHFDQIAGDEAAARELYGRACDGGEPRGCLRLASLALSRSRDDALAYRAARPGCEAGHLAACAMALEATRSSDQPGEEALRARAIQLFEERCTAGSPSACTNLGYVLARGEGGTADPGRARQLLDRACSAGHEPACRSLGALRGP